MTSVGLFAGRGDVILSMLIAFGGGIWLGYQLNTFVNWVRVKVKK
jgi:hypothetical protein